MYVTAIVLAAGKGLRFKSDIPKPLVEIDSRPIIIHCLHTFSQHPYIKDIIVVVNSLNKRSIINKIKKYRIKKIRDVVLGGKRRQDSVRHGLEAIDRRSDLVLIHDSVRPFVDKTIVSSLVKVAKRTGAAIVGVPVEATIKSVRCQVSGVRNKYVEKTLNRDGLWEIQTPQVFKKSLILKAYKKYANIPVTDDSALVEKVGARVKVVEGSYSNIKITTLEDLLLAEAIVKIQNPKSKAQNKSLPTDRQACLRQAGKIPNSKLASLEF